MEDGISLDGQHLYSARFDDHYASRSNPADEKHFVFFQGNDLEQRFRSATRFTIGELGFGAGISFLTTLQAWRQTAPATARLNYISTEMFPLARKDLTSVLAAHPAFSADSEQLLKQWPDSIPGFHRIEFDDVGVSLTLIFDDALKALRQINARVDAWYLDGFAPKKNPEMWRPEIFSAMRRLSHAQSTFATYTAAAQVRRSLEQQGFTVKKSAGYAQKRERLTGRIAKAYDRPGSRHEKPWFQRPLPRKTPPRHVAIIGAGIAGCASANRLAARHCEVTLFDQGKTLAAGTSKNPAALIQPYLSTDADIATHLSVQGYLYTLNKLRQLRLKDIDCGFNSTGLISRPKNKSDQLRKQSILNSNRYPPSFLTAATPETDTGAIYFPSGGWVDMAKLCVALVKEYEQCISLKLSCRVTAIKKEQNGWYLDSDENDSSQRFDAVIVANGHSQAEFPELREFLTTAHKGQLSKFSCEATPSVPVSQNGYVIPLDHCSVYVGSSYRADCEKAEITEEDNALNLKKLNTIIPNYFPSTRVDLQSAWSGIRAMTDDRLPLAGAVINPAEFIAGYGTIIRGERRREYPPPPYLAGLYLCTGLGSRAMTYGLICAELIASLCCDEALPAGENIYRAVHPTRVIARRIIRGKIPLPRDLD